MKSLTLALAALAAFAAPAQEPMAPMTPPPEDDTPVLITGVGMSVELGGGVGGYLSDRAKELTQVQGTWTARVTVGTRRHIGGELGYIGALYNLNALGVSQGAFQLGNGVEGDFRVNILTGIIQPYAVAGVAWLHYNVDNTLVNTSDFASSSDVVQFPLGGGLAFRYGGLIVDTRFTICPAVNSELLPSTGLSTWNLTGRAGVEF